MQTQLLEDEMVLDGPARNEGRPLRVVIAYSDTAAGKRAMHMLADLALRLGDEIKFHPIPWSFDLLTTVDWREVAASDAVNADILIIATSHANRLPSDVEEWAESAISRKRGTAAAVVALFGSDDRPGCAGSSRLETIQRAAHQAGLEFFAPAPRHELDQAIARVHQRAEMVTPVLEAILSRHVSAPGEERHN